MAKKNVLTLKDILERKEFFKNKNKETKELEIKRLDGNIVINKPDKELCKDCSEMEDEYESNKYFVYEILKEPNLKDPELQEAFEVDSPMDIVEKLFDVGEIVGISTEGMKFAGYYGGVEAVEDIKN